MVGSIVWLLLVIATAANAGLFDHKENWLYDLTDSTARLDIKSAINLTSNMDHFNDYLSQITKFLSPYIYEQCKENVSSIGRVEVMLSDPIYKPDGIGTKCIKDLLYRMENLKRLGLTQIHVKSWPNNLLKDLSNIKTLTALDIRNEKIPLKGDFVHFGKYFKDTTVDELNVIHVAPECVIDFADQIKLLKIHLLDANVESSFKFAVVLAKNAFVLKSLKIESQYQDFTYFLSVVQTLELPHIEDLSISFEKVVSYQIEYVKRLDKENKIFNKRRMYLSAQNLETLNQICGKHPIAIITVDRLDVTIPGPVYYSTFPFFTAFLTHHPELQRLSVQVNVISDVCRKYLRDIWAENHCKIFSIRHIIFKEILNGLENDKIEYNMDKVGLKATIPSGKFYELFAHEEFIELTVADSGYAYKYVAWFSILIRIVELQINEPTNLFRLIIQKVINNRKNLRNGELIWRNLKFLRGNIKVDDEERVKPIFLLEKLEVIVFALPDLDSANKVQKWQIDEKVWSPGKIVDESGLNLVEFRKLTIEEKKSAHF